MDEVPHSRPATSSTLRSSRAVPHVPAPVPPGPATNRSHYSSTHSVLSAGSYQAAAAAAAAAVVEVKSLWFCLFAV